MKSPKGTVPDRHGRQCDRSVQMARGNHLYDRGEQRFRKRDGDRVV